MLKAEAEPGAEPGPGLEAEAAPGPGLEAEADYAGRQSQGSRALQEDSYGVVPPADLGGGRSILAVVADGMGGHAAGEVASELAVQAFAEGFFDPSAGHDADRMWSGLERANAAIGRAVWDDPGLHGMGTTLVAVLASEGMARWISVGDSPLFLWRDGELRRLNRLHLVPRDQGEPASGFSLAAAVIGERLFEVDDPDPVALEAGDLLVAASDGINTLADEEIAAILGRAGASASAADHAETLLQQVEARGRRGQDNTTVVVVRWL